MTKIYFEWDRETKGAHLYREANSEGERITPIQGAIIGSIYIRKAALEDPENPPKKIEVDINLGE